MNRVALANQPELPAPASGPLAGLDPVAVSDLMLVTPTRRRANLIVLQPRDQRYVLIVKRGSSTLAVLDLASDLGNAAALRLALLAGIDPTGPETVRRLRLRIEGDTAEIMVAIASSPLGLEAELRPLSVNGKPFEREQRGQLRRCVRCAQFRSPQLDVCDADGGELVDIVDDPQPGGTIGAYRVAAVIGEGGMGTVLAAEHALIGLPVAIKLPHASAIDSPPLVRNFLSEARASSRLRHRNIVAVTDYGLISDGRPFMVMERLSGEPLRALICREGALRPEPALLIVREIALALAAAHAGGVVHRDLKPDNVIMLDGSRLEAPQLKLLDFGAALIREETLDEDVVMGTPSYMSPEHSRGADTDERSDLYALGVVLFELLSGNLPFEGNSHMQMRIAHIAQPAPPVTSPHGPLPEALTRIVARAMRKRPEERYQSAAEMMTDIEKALTVINWAGWAPG